MSRRLALQAALALLAGWSAAGVPALAQPASGLLAEVGKRLGNAAVLRGEFEQTKTIRGFKRPLVSRGTFVMARGQGVQWITTQPFASTLVITRDRLLTLGDNGVSRQTDARAESGLRAVNEMLLALLAGDVQVLGARFQSEGALLGTQGWRLVLTPRDSVLAGFITRIELQGDQYVNLAILHEASGDESRIRFFNHATSALSPSEAGRFGP